MIDPRKDPYIDYKAYKSVTGEGNERPGRPVSLVGTILAAIGLVCFVALIIRVLI